MSSRVSILASVVLLATVPAAGAQEKKKESEPKERRGLRVFSPGQCTVDGKDVECTSLMGASFDSVLAKRAALGIQLSSTGSLRDTIGVFIARVTPKGPAETAGIVEGERIVAINGVDLRLNSADAGDSYASGLASRRLTRELQKMTPGTRVNLRVWSGGRVRDVQVTAGSARDLQDGGRFGYIFDGGPGGFREVFPKMEMERLRDALPKVRIERRDGIIRL